MYKRHRMPASTTDLKSSNTIKPSRPTVQSATQTNNLRINLFELNSTPITIKATPKPTNNMSKVLAVFGATGQQGSSVINNVLSDPELSRTYSIRALTRNTTSPAAVALSARNVSVVEADLGNRASLEKALSGVHAVFLMTTPTFGPDAKEAEVAAAKLAADVAVAQGVEYIIFSTLASVLEISGGKYTKASHFDAKAEAEKYIRSLPIKSAYFMPAFFMENFHAFALAPFRSPTDADKWIITLCAAPSTRIPLLAVVPDSGKFVNAILAEPEKYEGKTFVAASELRSLEEIAAAMSKATGKNVVYEELSAEAFGKLLPPAAADVFVETFKAFEEFGYAGLETEAGVQWAVENARGKLLGLEEFLEKFPLKLE